MIIGRIVLIFDRTAITIVFLVLLHMNVFDIFPVIHMRVVTPSFSRQIIGFDKHNGERVKYISSAKSLSVHICRTMWICIACEKGKHKSCENSWHCDCDCNIGGTADATQKSSAILGGAAFAIGGIALTICTGGL